MSTSSTTSTMHYGGSLTGSKKLSAMPARGSSFKKTKRLEMIVRLENAGLPERAIAAMIMISVPRLRYIKKSAEYLSCRMRITHGIVLDTEASLAQIKEQRREYLKDLVPDAMQVIVNTIRSTPTGFAEKRLQVAVAQDLLDREGTFAKITRTEIKPVDAFDFERHDKDATIIIDAIKSIGAGAPEGSELERITDALTANKKFSNSETISHVDQQEALDELEASASLDLLNATPETEEIQ